MKKILTIILACIMHVSYAQNKPDNAGALICWQEGVKLRWKDFQAKTSPFVKSEFGANAAPEIDMKGFVDDKGKSNFLISCSFNKQNAWVRDSTFVLEFALLAHEQLHFDIAEIIARKLRLIVARSYAAGENVFGPALGKEIEFLLDEENEWDTLYDKETRYGTVAEQQRRWAALIKSELDKFKLYKSSAATCK